MTEYIEDRWIPGEYGDPGREITVSFARIGDPYCVSFLPDDRLWYSNAMSIVFASWSAFSEILDGDLYGCLDAGRV